MIYLVEIENLYLSSEIHPMGEGFVILFVGSWLPINSRVYC